MARRTLPRSSARLIDQLMSPADVLNEGSNRPNALRLLNEVLAREGFEAFYGDDRHCYLRHVGTNTVTVLQSNPYRPLTAVARRGYERERYAARAARGMSGRSWLCARGPTAELLVQPAF